MYGRLALAFGWTYHYIDEQVTVPMVREVFSYLTRYPPVNETFAAFIGYNSKSSPSPQGPYAPRQDSQGLSALARQPGVAVGDNIWATARGGKRPDWLPPRKTSATPPTASSSASQAPPPRLPPTPASPSPRQAFLANFPGRR